MKRKPPKHNVRRVRSEKNSPHPNIRFTVTNNNGDTVQCESFQEYIFLLRLRRNPNVRNFMSQPQTFDYYDKQGKLHHYTPDFMVWYRDGSIEIHEISLTVRRRLTNIQQREQAGHELCAAKGWRYVVHTEETLPKGAELANLEFLVDYAPDANFNQTVAVAIRGHLKPETKVSLGNIITVLADQLHLPQSTIASTLFYMLWHGKLQTDFEKLLVIDSGPTPRAYIWTK